MAKLSRRGVTTGAVGGAMGVIFSGPTSLFDADAREMYGARFRQYGSDLLGR